MMSECERAAERPSNTACPMVPRMATMKAAIMVLEWPGSKPCNAPSKMAEGMKSQRLVEPLWTRGESQASAMVVLCCARLQERR